MDIDIKEETDAQGNPRYSTNFYVGGGCGSTTEGHVAKIYADSKEELMRIAKQYIEVRKIVCENGGYSDREKELNIEHLEKMFSSNDVDPEVKQKIINVAVYANGIYSESLINRIVSTNAPKYIDNRIIFSLNDEQMRYVVDLAKTNKDFKLGTASGSLIEDWDSELGSPGVKDVMPILTGVLDELGRQHIVCRDLEALVMKYQKGGEHYDRGTDNKDFCSGDAEQIGDFMKTYIAKIPKS